MSKPGFYDRLIAQQRMVSAPLPARRHLLPPGECAYCDEERVRWRVTHPDAGLDARPFPFMPSHDASRHCESGRHTHCTCDTCF